jgi:hypothetical protein
MTIPAHLKVDQKYNNIAVYPPAVAEAAVVAEVVAEAVVAALRPHTTAPTAALLAGYSSHPQQCLLYLYHGILPCEFAFAHSI